MVPHYARGCIAPTFSIFRSDLSFDPDGQRRFLDFLLDRGGISAFFVRSGMGQMYTYSYEDVQGMARVACDHLKGRAPVLVGTTGIWDRDREHYPDPDVFTRQAVELSQYAEEQEADGVVHTIPEAILPRNGQTEADVILEYFETVSSAVSIPTFIYQPPGTAESYHVTHELLAQLAELPNLAGIKVSTADAGYIATLCAAVYGKDFVYITGNENAFYAGLYAGSTAVIGQGAAMYPQILNAVQDLFEAGDAVRAVYAQHVVYKLVAFQINSVEFFKRYATELGYEVEAYARTMKGTDYVKAIGNVSEEQYAAYKCLLEAELAPFL